MNEIAKKILETETVIEKSKKRIDSCDRLIETQKRLTIEIEKQIKATKTL